MADYHIKEFEDYNEQLCREHVDILHGTDGRVSFSRLRSKTEVDELVNNAGKNVVIMGRFNGRTVGDVQEKLYRQFVVLRFACYAENNDGDIKGGIDNAIALSQAIMFDWLARLYKDKSDDDCGILEYLELKDVSWDEIDEQIYLENHYGWDLTIPLKSYYPGYNAAKWQ